MRRLILAPLCVSTLALAESVTPEPAAFSLADAIAFAQQHSPRLRSARATIERARGQEQAAFAPFLPEIGLRFQSGATSNNQGPAATGPTGFILASTPGTHGYAQTELQLLWTLFDFGRRAGRHNQAAARERIAKLQLVRADQTVQFDVTAAYLNILLARASLLVQEDAIRQAAVTLKDARARLKGGVADPNDVLRAEVQLSESQEAYVNAREAESVAIAQLNNVMGRDAALPLRVLEVKLTPPERRRPSLAESLEIAAAERPEIGFARQAVVAAQEGVATAKAAFLPLISVRASSGRVDGAHVLTGWQLGAGVHLDVPLYTGGLLDGELHTAEAELAVAVADAQIIQDLIGLEVDRAFQSERAAGQRIELSRPAVVQAQENLRLLRVKYTNGDASPTDVVDAETALTRSQQRLNSAVYTYLAALARLDYATGRQRPRFP